MGRAIASGAGAEVQKPLATVVIDGLVTATLLTLFVETSASGSCRFSACNIGRQIETPAPFVCLPDVRRPTIAEADGHQAFTKKFWTVDAKTVGASLCTT